MIAQLYIILWIYFSVGAVLIAYINKKTDNRTKKGAWLKYFVYLILVNIVLVSIVFDPIWFHYLTIIIILASAFELIKATHTTKDIKTGSISILLFAFFAYGFLVFSKGHKESLFYTLYLVTAFDAFSQVSGQIFGRRKLIPKISPNKTFEGFLGGLLMTGLTSFLIRDLLSLSIISSLLVGFGMAIFCLSGDLLASFVKRKFGIKDFSQMIPGHGGFLDRFDSLYLAALFMLIITKSLGL